MGRARWPSSPQRVLEVRVSVASSRASGSSGVPLLRETIGDNLDRTVRSFPGRDALVDVAAGRRWTYAELGAEVDALALGLLDLGIVKGDRVGIWAPNRAEWTLVQYATAKIGAILVTVNPAYRSHELEYVLGQSGIRLLVAAERFKTSDYAAMIEEVRPRCRGWSSPSCSTGPGGRRCWNAGAPPPIRERWRGRGRP